jgi:hypothetical protein
MTTKPIRCQEELFVQFYFLQDAESIEGIGIKIVGIVNKKGRGKTQAFNYRDWEIIICCRQI